MSNEHETSHEATDPGGGVQVHKDTVNVTVRYAAAPKPFHDKDASREETLLALRGRVLDAFELTEGEATPEGNVITYKLYHEKTELTDLSKTVGDVAGRANALPLKLSQFIQQGA